MYTGRKKIKMQGKTYAHTKQIVISQVIELIRNKRIKTTPSKAKILKSVFDRLVTKSKLGNEEYVKSFFNSNTRSISRFNFVVSSFLQDRNSGYISVVKTLQRKGDNASQVYAVLVNADFNNKKSAIQKTLEKQKSKKK